MSAGWDSLRLDELEPMSVVNGTLLWQPIRRTLDIGAFGINAYVARNAGDDVVEEHSERALGHEEVYIVLAGRATFALADETVDAPAGTIVFIRDPEIRRHARAEEPGHVGARCRRSARCGVRALALGGLLRGRAPPHGRRLRRVRRGARGRAPPAPRSPATLYNLACAEALAKRGDDAIAHVTRAVELDPAFGEYAAKDEDLTGLRERPDWPL